MTRWTRSSAVSPLVRAVRRAEAPMRRREVLGGAAALVVGSVLGGLEDDGSFLRGVGRSDADSDPESAGPQEAADAPADAAAPPEDEPADGNEDDPEPAPQEPVEEEPAEEEPAAPVTYRRGDSGDGVRTLQKQLGATGYWCGTADGHFGHLTQQAVWALQKTHGLGRDALVGPQTRQALSRGTLPTPVGAGADRVEVHLGSQLVLVVRGGRTTMVLNTSTGNDEMFDLKGQEYKAVTVPGDFAVYSTHTQGWQKGPLGDLYRPMYFYRAIAIHGAKVIPPYAASHGCCRVSVPAMTMIWRDGILAMGSRVLVA